MELRRQVEVEMQREAEERESAARRIQRVWRSRGRASFTDVVSVMMKRLEEEEGELLRLEAAEELRMELLAASRSAPGLATPSAPTPATLSESGASGLLTPFPSGGSNGAFTMVELEAVEHHLRLGDGDAHEIFRDFWNRPASET